MTLNSKSVMGLVVPKMQQVRFGIIGTGGRSTELLRLLLNIEGTAVKAICDIDEFVLHRAQGLIAEKTSQSPELYSGSDYAYRELLERDDIDVVIIGTPWRWHVPMALDAMLAGKQALVEVTAALTIDECWQLVETSEKTQANCMMLENVCYGREEMMLLNMVRDNLFGELLHGEAAYIHTLKGQLKKHVRGESQWRPQWHAKLDGNLYPTHGLGPIAQYMNINRGDQFDFLNSISSPAIGRRLYVEKSLPENHVNFGLKHIAGDINTSLLKTKKGRTIVVQHDTTTPRPYTRLNLLQGTNGTFTGFPNRIALENNPLEPDVKDGFHYWDDEMQKWYEKYDHFLWRQLLEEAHENGGHGGMDFVMLWRIVYCLRNGLPLDQNVYDAAAWSAVMPLSAASVKKRGGAVDFPDFTRGQWQSNKPLLIKA